MNLTGEEKNINDEQRVLDLILLSYSLIIVSTTGRGILMPTTLRTWHTPQAGMLSLRRLCPVSRISGLPCVRGQVHTRSAHL